MANSQMYVEHAIYKCFAKNPRYRRELSRDDLASPDQVYSVFFETENSDSTDGYNSEVIFGRIIYEDERGKKQCGDSIMVKQMLVSDTEIRSKFTDVTFSNEIFVYSRIIPFFASFSQDIWSMFPKFYYGDVTLGRGYLLEDEAAIIILENLSASGYRLAKARTFLDIEELRLIVKKLAHFHAYSYYAKSKSPREFYSLVSNLINTNYTDTKEKLGFININSDHHIDVISKDERYAKKAEFIRGILKDADEFMCRMFKTAREPMAVLCHGDFLRNNVMLKYNAAGQPVDVKFFDLPCCRYCSPIIDLALILYMNTDQKTRDLYWNELIDVYCSSLQEPFPDVQVPSKEQVVEEFKINSLNAFLAVAFFLPQMMRLDEIPNYDIRNYYLPELAEFVDASWFDIPSDLERVAWKKVRKPHHEQAVLEVLKDIIDRGYV
ncbi:uncharacterized protein LOC135841926 [Planococcus citri]|uniref:uncharacterized protein LOC135841926 n=1 Tax=Planococcus citri TaxID=170843 RepID=UPI0031F863B0